MYTNHFYNAAEADAEVTTTVLHTHFYNHHDATAEAAATALEDREATLDRIADDVAKLLAMESSVTSRQSYLLGAKLAFLVLSGRRQLTTTERAAGHGSAAFSLSPARRS
jgi:hypothetical protein